MFGHVGFFLPSAMLCCSLTCSIDPPIAKRSMGLMLLIVLFVAVLGGLAGVAGRSGSEGYMCGDDSKSIRKERGQAAVQEVPTLRKGRTPLFRALLKDSE